MSKLSNINLPTKVFVVLSICVIIILLSVANNDGIISIWNLPDTSNSSEAASGYVTLGPSGGRLGNQMFNFAALFYVALNTGREVVLFNGHYARDLEKYFSLGVRKIKRSCPCFTFSQNVTTYDIRIEEAIRSQSATNSQTIILHGHFVSWKYIQPAKDLVRAHIKFRKSIEDFARDILRQIIPKGWTEGQFTRVGIHSRRGDFLKGYWSSLGFTTAPESYFKRAMKYFMDRYKLVQFIVVSEDTDWSREHIKCGLQSSSVNATYLEKHSPGQDMAILSLCDHVIMSTGTFGWMSAWLANGTTVYYSNFPRNDSYLSKRYDRFDYYPPNWIPMQ